MTFPPAFDPFALVLLAVLLVVIPLMGVKEFSLLTRWVRLGRQEARVRFYRWVMGFEWVLTAALLAWWFALGRGPAALNLVPAVAQWQWLAVTGGLVLAYLIIMQMNMVLDSDEQLRKMEGTLGGLRRLAPRDHREQAVFLQVSLTAGICEEILYRGMLMFVFTQAVGRWPALVLVALAFGLGHAYQGREGMLKTAAVGLAFGLLAVFSGSLYVGMVLHAVLDLTSGRIMQAAVNLPHHRNDPPDP